MGRRPATKKSKIIIRQFFMLRSTLSANFSQVCLSMAKVHWHKYCPSIFKYRDMAVGVVYHIARGHATKKSKLLTRQFFKFRSALSANILQVRLSIAKDAYVQILPVNLQQQRNVGMRSVPHGSRTCQQKVKTLNTAILHAQIDFDGQ